MTQHRGHNVRFIAAVVLISLQITSTAKTNSRPVYEVVNEQSKSDDKLIKTSAAASLPYGNPLAGNSQQNAKLYAHNQQAMFNAERVRQHKAQLQRWIKTPQLVNGYMRAYHESQENHQLALEQQQADLKEVRPKQAQRTRETLKRPKAQTDTTKTSKPDTGKPERKRIHRSYGSDEYQTVYLPSTAYNEAMKPNVINDMVFSQPAALYTDGSTNYNPVYTKYSPAQEYQSIQDIEVLNSLLNKNPSDQLTQFNALVNSAKLHNGNNDKELEQPINLYFYLKNSPLPDHNVYAKYAQTPSTIETPNEDYKPIKEVDHADKLEETPQYNSEKPSQEDSSVPKNIQYINTELANEIASAGYNPLYQEEQYYLKEEETPTYQELQYEQHPTPVYNQHDNSEDLSERYLHHNINKGVQHLTEDGTGVSAYGDDNLHYAASYEFGYRVRDPHSGNDFGHQEEKRGEATSGHYHVLLPDGRMQNVRYSAGPDGFHADITYDHQ